MQSVLGLMFLLHVGGGAHVPYEYATEYETVTIISSDVR